VPAFLGAGARQFGFMLRGLRGVAASLADRGIPFFLLRGDPGETVPALAASTRAGLVVADVSPLRLSRAWRSAVAAGLAALPGGGVPLAEVDAHNIVPVWGPATDKREVGARTLRPRLHRALPAFLTEFPPLPAGLPAWSAKAGAAPPPPPPPPVDWDAVIREATAAGAGVPEVAWCAPGEAAAAAALAAFATRDRLKAYLKRNDPTTGEW
jgi:deoxyribodipyrimidine photo-lyase